MKNVLLLAGLSVLAALAVFWMKGRLHPADGEAGAKVWFYDQSKNRLYPAPQSLIPPDGDSDVRVRAMVIGFRGRENKVSQLKIAYLLKYTPELKEWLEQAEAARIANRALIEKVPSQNSTYFRDNTLVKRPGEDTWNTAGTEEARKIMAGWRDWRGPDGQLPIISVPSM